MIIQLKCGKVVQLTVDEYLSLSDAELDALEGTTSGEYINSPFYGSATSKKQKKDIDLEEEDTWVDDTSEESSEDNSNGLGIEGLDSIVE